MNLVDRQRLAKQALARIGTDGWDIIVRPDNEQVLWTLSTPLLRIDCMVGKPNWYVGQATFASHRHREMSKSLVYVLNGLRKYLHTVHGEAGQALDSLIVDRTPPARNLTPAERRAENQRIWRIANNIDGDKVS